MQCMRWLSLYSGSADDTIRCWRLDAPDGAAAPVCTQTLEGHTDDVNALAVSADGGTLYSGSDDKTIRCWRHGASDGAAAPVCACLLMAISVTV